VTLGWLGAWLLGLAAAVLLMTAVWVVSLLKKDASIVDIFWGPGFALLAWLYFLLGGDGASPRRLLGAALATLWGVRLAAHIAWRALGRGEDPRYRRMRERHGARFGAVSLFTVFLLQAGLQWLISAPLMQVQVSAAPLGWLDALALAVFCVGFAFETLGDLELARFRADPRNRGRVLRTGLWRYTRHPNYFGDAVVWWSFFLLALATPRSTWTVYSPALMTFLLLRVSGVTLLEADLARSKPGYEDYMASTNAFFPWLPGTRDGGRT